MPKGWEVKTEETIPPDAANNTNQETINNWLVPYDTGLRMYTDSGWCTKMVLDYNNKAITENLESNITEHDILWQSVKLLLKIGTTNIPITKSGYIGWRIYPF